MRIQNIGRNEQNCVLLLLRRILISLISINLCFMAFIALICTEFQVNIFDECMLNKYLLAAVKKNVFITIGQYSCLSWRSKFQVTHLLLCCVIFVGQICCLRVSNSVFQWSCCAERYRQRSCTQHPKRS